VQGIDLEGARVADSPCSTSLICRSNSSPRSVRISCGRGRGGDVERAGQGLPELLPLTVLAIEAAHLPQNGDVVGSSWTICA